MAGFDDPAFYGDRWAAVYDDHFAQVAIRYSYPAELDLMASSAGLRLAGRYAGWDRQPFTSASDSHISVYQRT